MCTVFALLLILGIPENWYKSSQFAHTLLLDIIYFSLLLILLLLLSFSFTLAHYLRRKDQLALLLLEPNNQPQLSLSSSAQLQHQRHQFSQHQYRPFNNTNNICTCSPQRFLEIANTNNSFNAEESSNNGTKIVDSKWFPNSLMEDISAAATASLSRTNNLFVTSSRANNNNHNHRFANNQHHAIDCHLSDFQTPLPLLNSRFGASNTCNRRQISATKRGMQLANKLALSTSHLNQQHQSVNATSTQDDDRQLLLDSYSYANAPSNTQELVHKGFYRREGEESVEENHLPLNGARSFSRVSNGNNVDVYGDEADEEEARSSGTDTGATRANNNDEQLDIHNFQTSNVPDDAGLERSAWCRRRTVHVNELVAGNEDCTNRISNGRGSSGGCGHQHRQRHRQTNQNARANNQAGFSRDDSSIQYTNYSQGTNTQQLIKNQSLHVPAWYNQPAYQQHLHHHRKQQQQQQQQKQERQEHQLEQPHHFHRIIPKIRSHSHCQSQSQSQSQPQSNCQSQSNSQSSSVHPHSTNAMHQNQLSFPFPSHQYQSATLAGQTCTCNQVLTLPSNATTTPKATTTSSSLTNAIQRLSLANLNLKANLSPYTTPMLLNNSTSTLAIRANKSKKGSAKGSSGKIVSPICFSLLFSLILLSAPLKLTWHSLSLLELNLLQVATNHSTQPLS